MQICNELSTISYASVLKNSLSRKRYNSECEQMTWYDQVEKFERDESKVRFIFIGHLDSMEV